MHHKYSQNYPAVSSINNVSFKGGRGVISQKLTLANRGGGGSQMAKIRLTLLMDSPLVQNGYANTKMHKEEK